MPKTPDENQIEQNQKNQIEKGKHGGWRPNSGRPKTYKKKESLRKKLLESELMRGIDGTSLTPLEVILYAVKTYWQLGRLGEAVSAATIAAPYIHPKLTAVAVQGKMEHSLTSLIEASMEMEKQLAHEKNLALGVADTQQNVNSSAAFDSTALLDVGKGVAMAEAISDAIEANGGVEKSAVDDLL